MTELNIPREKQVVYLKAAWSLDPFAYAGSKAAVEGVQVSYGQTVRGTPVDVPGIRGAGGSWAAGNPGAVKNSLRMKKSVAGLLTVEEWLVGLWHIDVRYQLGGSRNHNTNWNLIERYNRCRITDYQTDAETVISQEESGEIMVSMPFTAPARYMSRFFPLVVLDRSFVSSQVNVLAKVYQSRYPRASRMSMDAVVIAGTEATIGHARFGRSENGGRTWLWATFNGAYSTPTWDKAITGIAGIPEIFVVVSEDMNAHAYSLDGGSTWAEVVLEGYTSHAPRDVALYGATNFWFCGEDGYVWFSPDGMVGTIAHAGIKTAENLLRIKAHTDRLVLAVGENNAILKGTQNGWSAVNAPTAQAAVDILDIGIYTERVWAIGYNDGTLWLTENGGETWAEDPQVASMDYGAIRQVDVDPLGRWIIAGQNNGVTAALIHENVNGGLGHWQLLSPDTHSDIRAVLRINENEFVMGGRRAASYGCYRLGKG